MSGEVVPLSVSRADALPAVAGDMPERLRMMIEATGGHMAEPDPADPVALFQRGIMSFQSSTVQMARAGWYFARAKALAGGGRAWVDAQAAAARFGKDHVYRAINVLEQLVRAPEPLVDALRQTDYTKILLLKKLDDQDLDDLVDHGQTQAGLTLEEFEDLSVRDLAERLRRTSDTEYRLRNDLRKANLTLISQREELEAIKQPLSGHLPHSVATARTEGPALAQAGQQMIARLTELCVAVVQGFDLPADHLPRQMLLRDGLGPPVAALRLLHAQIAGALAQLNDTVGHYLPDIGTITPLSLDEVQDAQQIFDGLYSLARERQALADKAARDQRAATKAKRKRRA